MRCLVTGAYGYLGRHLLRAFVNRGDFVTALVRDYTQVSLARLPSAIVYGGFDQVERAIAEYECDVVVHLAAQVQVSTAVADPIGTFEANIEGTWKVLEACRRQNVKRIIVASSDKAYGDGETPYKETQPLRPHGIYATSKACADSLAQAYLAEYDMSVAITRCGNLFGPGHTNWSTLIPGTIRSVLKGERPVLRSNGGPRRDFLYVEDAVDGYLKLAESTATGPFNFGRGGKGTTVAEVVSTVLKVMESKLEPVVADNSSSLEIQDQVLDYSRAAKELGWVAKHGLTEGLTKTVAWYREHLKERS